MMCVSAHEEDANRLRRFYRRTCRVDFVLGQCYSAGFCLTLIFFLLPSQLSRIGAIIMLVALSYMIAKILAAHCCRQSFLGPYPATLLAADLARLQARMIVADSAFFNIPFLVGANLVFMGLPVSHDPVHEAALDCAFLAVTVFLFSASFLANQLLLRRKLLPPFVVLHTPAR